MNKKYSSSFFDGLYFFINYDIEKEGF